MRICIFSTTYFPKTGGAERFIHGLASQLSNLGHKVFVLVPYDKKLDLQSKVSYKILSLKFLAPVQNSKLLFEAVLFSNVVYYSLRYKFDLIQAVIIYPVGFIASLMTKFFKIPSFLRPTGEDIQIYKDLNYGFCLDPFVKKRVSLALKNSSAVVAISPSIEKDLLRLNCLTSKIFSIPNGLDLERFSSNSVHDIKSDLGLKSSDKVVISVGRNHPKKDYKTLIGAISKCPKEVKLVIIGGNEEELKEYIPKEQTERIFILGKVPRDFNLADSSFNFPPDLVLDYLKTADLYVSTSLIEGSPNVILEAIAAKLPIVAVDALGTRDYIQNGRNGLLVSPKNPEELSKAIMKVLSDREMQKRFSDFNREYRKEFDWKKVADKYETMYNRMVK